MARVRERPGSLVVVATPIGNLGDLSPRAVEALRAAALICAEDTRRLAKLLSHAGISGVRVEIANEHTERRRVADVLAVLADGGDVVLVSDAGTPGISDPGERLVRAAVEAGYEVTSVPGPVAAVVALVVSGLATSRFVFEGFLPRSGSDRATRLAEIAAETRTTVIYESPHRVERTMHDLAEACGGERPAAVARELTKRFEEVVRGSLGSIDLGAPRGEYVIVVAGAADPDSPPDEATIADALRAELTGGSGTKEASVRVAAALGIPRRLAYAIAVDTVRTRE